MARGMRVGGGAGQPRRTWCSPPREKWSGEGSERGPKSLNQEGVVAPCVKGNPLLGELIHSSNRPSQGFPLWTGTVASSMNIEGYRGIEGNQGGGPWQGMPSHLGTISSTFHAFSRRENQKISHGEKIISCKGGNKDSVYLGTTAHCEKEKLVSYPYEFTARS